MKLQERRELYKRAVNEWRIPIICQGFTVRHPSFPFLAIHCYPPKFSVGLGLSIYFFIGQFSLYIVKILVTTHNDKL
jgi:hypothetical protein